MGPESPQVLSSPGCGRGPTGDGGATRRARISATTRCELPASREKRSRRGWRSDAGGIPVPTIEVTRYVLYHYSQKPDGQVAQLLLWSANNAVANIQFYKDGATLPANEPSLLYFHQSQLRDILETVRVEKPLWVT